ncbi:Hsp70 family protein [Methanobrevibacter oralis]|uniref:Hsp70 family protein n=1 Tax=Methanobrevibacter oralis TaxID=66851 RepID=UPI0005B284AB|nr:Hsp70 family protein [Methanobrevibacter oralis]
MSKKLRTNTVDFGIDLGTTTSIIARVDGNDAPIIPNFTSNTNFTPSAVAIDKRGTMLVGEKAKRQALSDPKNAFSEFKLRMGIPKPYVFQDSGRELLPEELSAEVLKELKNSVFKQLNQDIDSVVITVPADFGPTKTLATNKAAKLAGFEYHPLIMEPVAAAYAYGKNASEDEEGIWLIYDLGGGTFDVSIVRLNDDEFEHVSHSGDEYLGGKLIDWDIVDNIFAKKISDDLGIFDFNRKNQKYIRAFAKLKGAAEQAKKDLSTLDYTDIFVENLLVHDNDVYDFDYILTRDELKDIMSSYIKRTINHCNKALNKASLTINDIDNIILVGGSTLSPIIRESLENEFNIPLKFDIDPVTVVAKGAAIYAGTLIKPSNDVVESDKIGIELNYSATGPRNEEFFVSGRIFSENINDFDGFYIEAINVKTETTTGKVPVESDGYFDLELMPENDLNEYSINLYGFDGSLVEIDENSPNAIIYNCQAVAGTPILPHTLGLGLFDDSLFILAKEGVELPYVSREVFKTKSDVIKGDDSTFISMPLYNGTAEVASRNTKVGELNISGSDVNKTLKSESDITVKIDIDESRLMKFDVMVPDLEQSFVFKITPDVEEASVTNVKRKYQDAKQRFNQIKEECCNNNDEVIDEYWKNIEEEDIINNIDNFINVAENDEDAAIQADKRLNDLNDILDNIEKT